VINQRHFNRLTGYLEQGTVVMGGQTDASDLYLAPTILTDVSPQAAVMQDEIFGPILPVLEVASVNEAIEFLADRPAPLAFYVFTRDAATQQTVLDRVRSGGACVNDTVMHMVGNDMPFGGLGDSGFGSYHGKASFDRFTHYRAVLRRSLRVDPAMRYPPPKTSLETLKRAFRFLLG
jgi:aldehyde dehydrogenase (NAD+)